MNISPANITVENFFLFFVFFFFIALTFFFRDIPFFWDSSIYCGISRFYYDTDFSSLIVPPDLDPAGSPMIYWVYHAVVWKIFGKTLVVSHLAVLPFLLGIAWEYYKLAKRFLSPPLVVFALLLLLAEPTFLTQSIVMGYDVPKAYLFLLGLNALLSKKNILFAVVSCFLVFSSMRGIFLAGSLFILHFFICIKDEKRIFRNEVIWHLPGSLCISVWTLYHYTQTGWLIFSSNFNYSGERDMVPMSMMFRQCIYILWELVDFGRIFIWGFIVIGTVFLWYRQQLSESAKLLLIFLTVPLAVFILAIAPFSIPIGHKYFLILFLLSPIAMLQVMQQIIYSKKMLIVLSLLFPLILLSGNFWIYGGGFSNGWDSSLKVLPYFTGINEIRNYIKSEKINPLEVGTKFPMYHDMQYSDLSSESFHFTDINFSSIHTFPYILLSNVSNQFTEGEKETLKNEWELQKEFHSGLVYLKLFRNRRQ